MGLFLVLILALSVTKGSIQTYSQQKRLYRQMFMTTNIEYMASGTGSNILPSLADEDEYSAVYADNTVWLPAIRAVCQRHGISTSGLKRTVLGTHIVFQAGERIVKLFSSFWPQDYSAEVACLAGLKGLPIPELVATGGLEGWSYLIMTVLDGKPTGEVWGFLAMDEKISVMHQLGEFIWRLHDHLHIDGLPSDWDTFLHDRIDNLDEHHKLAGDWSRWGHNLVDPLTNRPKRLVVLNCDLTNDHILLVDTAGKWDLSGVIDFGDAMIGHPYYEFTAPLLDHAFGQPALAAALLDAYGEPLTDNLRDELSRYLLTHKFWGLADMPGDPMTGTPQDFLATLWGA